jgi:hypothetical protein
MTDELDKQLKDAGMLSVSELMNGSPIDGFQVHSGMNNLSKFSDWLDMRTKEMMRMKAGMELNKTDNNDLYEWVLSHVAVLNEVRVNFNAATKSN